MIRFTSWKFFSTAALSGLLLAAGCGDDDGDTPAADASTPDADDTDEPDTEPEIPPHTGLIAIFEADVLGPAGADPVAGGAVVSVGWQDQATATVDPVPGFESNLTGCLITVYDVTAGETPAEPTDEGAVTVEGTAYGQFTCAFNEGTYNCQAADEAATGAIATGSTVTPANPQGVSLYTFQGADFSGIPYVGMWIQVSGFTLDSSNGLFQIAGQMGDDGLLLVNPAAVADTMGDTPGQYTTLVGVGPVPGPGGVGLDLLPAEAELTVSKGESDFIPAFETTIVPNGEGFTLDAEEGDLPNAVPTDGSAVTFACPTEGGCGAEEGGMVKGLIVSGSTTDAPLPEVNASNFFLMPDPVSSYATYQCSAIGAPRITIPAAGMEAILDTNPTRMQFNVAYVAGNILGDTTVLTGHAIGGFTDVPAGE